MITPQQKYFLKNLKKKEKKGKCLHVQQLAHKLKPEKIKYYDT